MENILELFYDLTPSKFHEQDSLFVRYARIKNAQLDMLIDSMTDEQKKLLESYFDADTKIEDIIQFDRFHFAFHLGAQLMAELIEGKGELWTGK